MIYHELFFGHPGFFSLSKTAVVIVLTSSKRSCNGITGSQSSVYCSSFLQSLLTINTGPDGNIVPSSDQAHLTSAFEDVILVPLASWIFLLFFLPVLALTTRRHRRVTLLHVKEPSKHFLCWHDYVKLFFAAAVIAMACLEIARLAKLGYGIGLLPFTPVCVALAITINVCRHKTFIRGKPLLLVIVLYYLFLLAFESVKLNTQIRLEMPYPRKGSQYPASDQVIDMATLVACLGVLIVLTLLDLILG
jgi:hypothetical protein